MKNNAVIIVLALLLCTSCSEKDISKTDTVKHISTTMKEISSVSNTYKPSSPVPTGSTLNIDETTIYDNLPDAVENKPNGYGVSPGNAGKYFKPVGCDGEWIYYSDDGSIYRVKNDGSKKEKIYHNDNCVIFGLNVLNGWLYFVLESYSGENFCKIKTDGTDLEIIESGVSFCSLQLINNSIYFNNNGDDPKTWDSFCKMDINTKKVKWLYVLAPLFQVVGNEIYMYTGRNDDGQIICIDTDGENRRVVTEDHVNTFCIYDEWIYYVKNDDERKVYKVRKDGNRKTLVNTGEGKVSEINVTKDWIFYNVFDDNSEYDGDHKNAKLYRMSRNGENKILLTDNISSRSDIDVVGSWVFYNDFPLEKLCRVSLDGKIREKFRTGLQDIPLN